MDPARFKQINEAFVAVLDLPERERPAYLAQLRERDSSLAEEVDRLLAADESSEWIHRLNPAGVDEARDAAGSSHGAEKLPESVAAYQVQRMLGRGGMGVVLGVWDDELKRELALKLSEVRQQHVPRDSSHIDTRLQRFIEEARITGQLDHPGVVPVHNLGRDERGRPFFTMQVVEGVTFRDVIDRVHDGHPEWTLTRALNILLRAAEAIAYAQSKNVIHRDLKPSNIMVGKFGETYVMDWGLAKELGEPDVHDLRLKPRGQESSQESSSQSGSSAEGLRPLMTMDGDVVGTPEYMPPEQAAGAIDEVGPASDVYSIGAVLYHLLSGERPYRRGREESTPYDIVDAVRRAPPEPLDRSQLPIAPELIAICKKAMRRDPQKRYPSMMELAEDLRAFLDHRVVRAYRTGPLIGIQKWVRRNRIFTTAACSVVLIVAVAAFLIHRAEEGAKEARAGTLYELHHDGAPAISVWLGPQKSRVDLDLPEENAFLTPPLLLVTEDAPSRPSSLPWELLSQSPASFLLLKPNSSGGFPTFHSERVFLKEAVDQGARTRAFELSYVTKESWFVDAIKASGVALSEVKESVLLVDGGEIEVVLGGPGLHAVDSVTVDGHSMRRGSRPGRFLADLETLGWTEGSHEPTFSLRDRADNEKTLSRQIRVVPPLIIQERTLLRDQQEVTHSNNSRYYLYASLQTPHLNVVLNREAALRWRILGVDVPPSMTQWQEVASSVVHRVPLRAFQEIDRSFEGTLEIEALDRGVLGGVSSRGPLRETLELEVATNLPEIDVTLIHRGEGLFQVDEPREHSVQAGETILTRWPRNEYRVRNEATFPLRVKIPGVRKEPVDLEPYGEFLLPISLTSSQRRSLTFQVFLPEAEASTPVHEFVTILVHDSTPPRLDFQASRSLIDRTDAPLDINASLQDEANPEKMPALQWFVVDATYDATSANGIAELRAHATTRGTTMIAESSVSIPIEIPKTDGEYRVAVLARDEAYNPSLTFSDPFVVALTPPRLELTHPNPRARMWPDPDPRLGFRVDVQVLDSNGVDHVRCRVDAKDQSIETELQPIDADRKLWSGRLRGFRSEWIRETVVLSIVAQPCHGESAALEDIELAVPIFTEILPARLDVIGTDDSKTRARSMRLIRGNTTYDYWFRGENDFEENERFRRAGLLPRHGSFAAGRAAGTRGGQGQLQPARTIADFYLDENEVTNGEYLAFLRSPDGYRNRENWTEGVRPDSTQWQDLEHRLDRVRADEPVTAVTWFEADAYATWVGKRLPTWLEWEYEVRAGQHYYVYASQWDRERTPQSNILWASPGKALWCGGEGGDVSLHGIRNLCGNVSEWTSTPSPTMQGSGSMELFVVTGGAFDSPRMDFWVAHVSPAERSKKNVGFRCALSASEARKHLESAEGPYRFVDPEQTSEDPKAP